ncbi:hypothetical protein J5N97_013196 [Dioscorea zingiberensis]|uniref:Uncharacterized protein n=1 Tax=Dioscorea zingiberensis TaxID=325984 RepID=A0A9D5CRQ3_9LILI|nr:hypothetical protein J5N97_013196 [Dioscorea zingiberensis]
MRKEVQPPPPFLLLLRPEAAQSSRRSGEERRHHPPVHDQLLPSNSSRPHQPRHQPWLSAPCRSALCSLADADGCGNCFSPPLPAATTPPAVFAAFPAQAALSVRHNRLRGGIPVMKKVTSFWRLFLDGNFLNGRVPAGFLGTGAVASAGEGLTGSFGDKFGELSGIGDGVSEKRDPNHC